MEQTQNTLVRRTAVRQQNEEMISLRDIIDVVLMNRKWFIVSAIVCVVLARLYLTTQPFIYQRQAVILIKEDNGSGSRSKVNTDALMQLNGVITGSSVKNEVYILKSHRLVKEVVKNLHLDVLYIYKLRFQHISLYDQKPFEVQFMDSKTEPASFSVEVLNPHECKVSGSNFEKQVCFGEMVQSPVGRFTIVPNPQYLLGFVGKSISVSRIDLESATDMIMGRISTDEIDKESALVRITCTDTNIQRADDVLATLIEAYKRSIVEDKNKVAQSTADFIDERIGLISGELSKVEGQLASFKQSNNLVDLSANAQAYLQQSTTARQRTLQSQTQQSVAWYLLDYLKSNSKGNNLIPALGGLSDNGIQSQISAYNELMLTRNRLAENSGENGPTIAQMDSNLAQMRQAIISSMQAYLASINVELKQAENDEQGLSGTLDAVPQQEKKMIDISRQQSIKETLYTYLLNKREETALQLAITEANIRVVEQPFGSRGPIAPRKAVITVVALLIGLVVPFVFFQIRNMLNMGVRGRKDVEQYTSIPVLGEIPHRKEGIGDEKILVDEQQIDSISEAFRMMRFSLNFVNKGARVIMFTSTTPGEGKTFVSRNFAVTLGMTGKRVILIDSDIRKRTQSKLSGFGTHQEGLTSYLSGSIADVNSIIIQDHLKHGIDFLPAGIVPPNPAELLMSEKLDGLVAELKKIYDYIVIDNVPAQVVADAGIVNRVADMTIYVIRDGKIDRRYLPELQRLYDEKKLNNMCILINDAQVEKNGYGFGYGYGYGYGNGDKKERKHRFLHMF